MIEEQYFKAELAYDTFKTEMVKQDRERRQRKKREALEQAEIDQKVAQNKKPMNK